MKKTIFLIILIAILVIFYFFVKKPVEAPHDEDSTDDKKEIVDDRENEPLERQSSGEDAYLSIAGGEYFVTGTNITVSIDNDIIPFVDDENFIEGSVAVQKEFAVGFKKGEDNYVLVPVAVNNGGTGVFVNLALFKEVEGKYQSVDQAFLGDRIIIKDLYISNDQLITVELLDRSPDESFASEPTVPVTAKFSISTDDRIILVRE